MQRKIVLNKCKVYFGRCELLYCNENVVDFPALDWLVYRFVVWFCVGLTEMVIAGLGERK